MKAMMGALLVLAAVGCERNEQQPAATESSETVAAPATADNTARNKRDMQGAEPTAQDQSENSADRTITQQIRRQVIGEDGMSMNAKNVKIITVDGVVTLRGPVQNEKERADIGSAAKRVDGVKRVDNLLEIAAK